MDRKLIDYLPPVLREVLELKAMWNLEIHYTLPWLRKWLTDICGPDGHEEAITDYTIQIQLDYTALPDADSSAGEILKMLLAVRPDNMRVMLTAFLQSYGKVSFGAATETAHDMEIYPRRVRGMKTTGALHCGIFTELSSRVEIWPRMVRSMESWGTFAMVGSVEYHSAIEIFPKEGLSEPVRFCSFSPNR